MCYFRLHQDVFFERGAKAGEVQALVERLKREQCGTPVPSPVRMQRYLPF